MRLIKEKTSIDFLGDTRRRIALALSAVMIVVSLTSLATRGLELGIDFTGGVLLEVGYPQEADLDRIRTLMTESGHDDAQVQTFGAVTDVKIGFGRRLDVRADTAEPQKVGFGPQHIAQQFIGRHPVLGNVEDFPDFRRQAQRFGASLEQAAALGNQFFVVIGPVGAR